MAGTNGQAGSAGQPQQGLHDLAAVADQQLAAARQAATQQSEAERDKEREAARKAAELEVASLRRRSVAFALGHFDPVTLTFQGQRVTDFRNAMRKLVKCSDFPNLDPYEEGLLYQYKKEFFTKLTTPPQADADKFNVPRFHGACMATLKGLAATLNDRVVTEPERLLLVMLAAVELDIHQYVPRQFQTDAMKAAKDAPLTVQEPLHVAPLFLFPDPVLESLVRQSGLQHEAERDRTCIVLSLQLCIYKLREASKTIIATNAALQYSQYVDLSYFGIYNPAFFHTFAPESILPDGNNSHYGIYIGSILDGRKALDARDSSRGSPGGVDGSMPPLTRGCLNLGNDVSPSGCGDSPMTEAEFQELLQAFQATVTDINSAIVLSFVPQAKIGSLHLGKIQKAVDFYLKAAKYYHSQGVVDDSPYDGIDSDDFEELVTTMTVKRVMTGVTHYAVFKGVYERFMELLNEPLGVPEIKYGGRPERSMTDPAIDVYGMVHDHSHNVGEKINQLLKMALALSVVITPKPYLDGLPNSKERGQVAFGNAAAAVVVAIGHNIKLEKFADQPRKPDPKDLVETTPSNTRWSIFCPTYHHSDATLVPDKRKQILNMLKQLSFKTLCEGVCSPPKPLASYSHSSRPILFTSIKEEVVEHFTGDTFQAYWDKDKDKDKAASNNESNKRRRSTRFASGS